MAAVFIAQVETRNREAFREYERGVLRTIRPYKGWVLAAGPGLHADGATPRNHNVIIRFPGVEQAQAWWDSTTIRRSSRSRRIQDHRRR